MNPIKFFTDEIHGLARASRSAIAALSIGGFAWASNFTAHPNVAFGIQVATVISLLVVAAHDGKSSDA